MHRAFLCALLVAGCTAAPAAEEGIETGPCLDNGCFGGLQCLSNLCVDPDWEPDGGSDDDDDEDEDEDDGEDDGGESDPGEDSDSADGSDTDSVLTGGVESSGTGDSDPTGSSTDPTFDPTDPSGDESSESTADPTDGDAAHYADCNSCSAGETPVAIEGVEGCFCAPMCDGTSCPAPFEGTAEAMCALALDGATEATHCALICDSTAECPDGATCEDAGGASICMHPA